MHDAIVLLREELRRTKRELQDARGQAEANQARKEEGRGGGGRLSGHVVGAGHKKSRTQEEGAWQKQM